jgi:hypothetical protein
VLAVRGEAPGGAAERPAVGVGDELVGVRHHPRLERQQQAGAQRVPPARPARVRDVRVLVHRRPDAVPAELRVDRVPRRREHGADRVRDVPEPHARSGRGDPVRQRALGRLDQRLRAGGSRRADDEADRGVGDDPVQGHGQVQGQQVAVREAVVVRQPVQHRVVDGRADVVPERPAPERGRVVDVAGLRPGGEDHLPRPAVDVQQVGPDDGARPQGREDVVHEGAGGAGPADLRRVEDLDHLLPSTRRIR